MTEFDMVKRCADSMGLDLRVVSQNLPEHTLRSKKDNSDYYWPITNDAQAMALVKAHGLCVTYQRTRWIVGKSMSIREPATDVNLNVAICMASIGERSNAPAKRAAESGSGLGAELGGKTKERP